MKAYRIVTIINRPDVIEKAAHWFSEKWKIPYAVYLESMYESINGKMPVPQWYLVLDEEKIIAGLGVIENDFHDRKDLSPNICAVYVEEKYRCQGVAGMMLAFACHDMKEKGIDTLFLVTDLASFYERYNWEYICMVQGDGETECSKMYRHREN